MTINVPDLLVFKDEIFAINSANGFWEMGVKNRSWGETCALVISESSEALEYNRKPANDDKLPEYNGVWVELADIVIRTLDHIGANNLPYEQTAYVCDYGTFSEFTMEINLLVAHWYVAGREDSYYPSAILENIVDYCNENNIPLLEIIVKKNAANKARGYKHGGKAF